MLLTTKINGVEIAYDQSGFHDGPPLVLLTGWAHDINLYDELLPVLASNHRVIRVCYRLHGPTRQPFHEFGVAELVDDTLSLLDTLDIDDFYLVSHSHGGWVALEMVDRVGPERVRALLMLDQIMTQPPSGFAASLREIQSKQTWLTARKHLFENWMSHSTNKAVHDHHLYSLGSFGFDMWALSCKVIEQAYATWGSPMGRMEKIKNPPPIRHIFSHPLNSPGYRHLHEEFSAKHSWFSYTDLKGKSHFPSLEIPEQVGQEIEELIEQAAT
jgi:pimeloyl-ACP methyl ester carboxylesterase